MDVVGESVGLPASSAGLGLLREGWRMRESRLRSRPVPLVELLVVDGRRIPDQVTSEARC